MSERMQTHHADCWRDPKHHACAVARVEALEELVASLAGEKEEREKPCKWGPNPMDDTYYYLCQGYDLTWLDSLPPNFCPHCGHPVEVKG
jgi:hypothetical protein